MDVYNRVPDLSIEYNEPFRETVSITGEGLKIKKAWKGTGYILIGSLLTRRVGFSLYPANLLQFADAKPADLEVAEELGRIEVALPERFDCTGFCVVLRGSMFGALRAPALYIERAKDGPVFVFIFRSPKSTFQWLPAKHELSVAHKPGSLTAVLREAEGGGLQVQLSNSGAGYNRGTVFLRRSLAPLRLITRAKTAGLLQPYQQMVGEVIEGSAELTWEPGRQDFGFIACLSTLKREDTRDFLLPFGVDFGELGVAGHSDQSFYCDGPGVDYTMYLRGHKTMMSDDDTTELSVVSLGQGTSDEAQ